MRVAVDAMGGDNAPRAIVEGAVRAAENSSHEVILVGDQDVIRQELSRLGAGWERLSVQHASEIIAMDESPASACREKKDASILVAMRLVKEGRADAVVSAGNSGATMAAALLTLGRVSGVSRPAIACPLPTLKGLCVIVDAGANTDCKPEHLLQFALMGSVYVRAAFNRPRPRVGVLTIGEEEGKGNALVVETFPLLKRLSAVEFVGNLEGRDVPVGKADVVVCDGFVGNVVLKFAEGMGSAMVTLLRREMTKNAVRKMVGLLFRGPLKSIKKDIDPEEYGGAPLLGVNGAVLISHGGTLPKGIRNAVRAAAVLAEQKIHAEIGRVVQEEGHIIRKSETRRGEPDPRRGAGAGHAEHRRIAEA